MDPLALLALAGCLFVASHFAMSHPLRSAMITALGERGFLGAYSAISLLLFGWMAYLFGRAPSLPLAWDSGEPGWIAASVLTVLALVLLFGSLRGNPALPQTGADAAAHARAEGVFAVTRHPMMWGFGLWAIAHIIVWPGPRTLVTAGAIAILALAGAYLQDRKKRRLLPEAWAAWESRTTYWPRPGGLGQIGWRLWLAALAAWLGLTWAHQLVADIPAGIWRYFG